MVDQTVVPFREKKERNRSAIHCAEDSCNRNTGTSLIFVGKQKSLSAIVQPISLHCPFLWLAKLCKDFKEKLLDLCPELKKFLSVAIFLAPKIGLTSFDLFCESLNPNLFRVFKLHCTYPLYPLRNIENFRTFGLFHISARFHFRFRLPDLMLILHFTHTSTHLDPLGFVYPSLSQVPQTENQ